MKFKYLRKQISHLSWVFTHSQKKQGWHFSSEYLGIVGWASKKETRHLTICVYIKIYIYIYICIHIYVYIYIYICCICQLSITSELRPSHCKGLEIWQDIVVSIRFSQKLTGFATVVGYLIGAAGTTRMCWISYTSSTAQGGGGSFKNRKRIGEIDGCEWRMSEQKHWPTD